MSYASRVYRQRNAHSNDETTDESPFFTKADKQSGRAKNNQSFFQPKLEVGPSNDQYEKEADAVAGAVVNNKNKSNSVQQKKISSIQRLATPEDEEKTSTNEERMKDDKVVQQKPELQAKCDECEKEEKEKGVQKMDDPEKEKDKDKKGAVQKMGDPEMEKDKDKKGAVQKMGDPEMEKDKDKKGAVQKMGDPEMEKEKDKKGGATPVQKKGEGSQSASPQLSSRIEQSAGTGKELPGKTLQSMESSFDRDFSNVNIHTGADSAEMTRDLGAQAFTHGNDIYFNSGKYNPDTSTGQQLLAHELTHVVQQGKAGKKGGKKKGNKKKD